MSPRKSLYSRRGAPRAGDEYQDLWGIEVLLEWLEHPERYEWVRFEYSEAGALDDVVAKRAGGGLVCRQMKHTVDPDETDYAGSWDWLCKQKNGKKGPGSSMLQHWAASLDKQLAEGEIVEAGLYTNRKPEPDLKSALVGLRIDLDRIGDAALRGKIEAQLGGAEKAQAFFARFDFHLDLPGYEPFEEMLKERFMRVLGGTKEGWSGLREAARTWAIQPDRASEDGRITLDDVRRAALWRAPKALSQDFEVPEDYVLPDEAMRDGLVADILQPDAGAVVLAAGPGFGKSTFLSHLTDHLAERNIPVIRHHYFMAARERAEDRFSHTVVLEALMAQLQRRHADLLGEVGNRNPSVERFGDWLKAAGETARNRNTKLIVIVDGLDHIWREQGSSDELRRLFELLLPAPDGVCVLIGTQPLNDAIPARLNRYAPRESWRSLPRLTETAVRELLRRNRHRLGGAGGTAADDHLLDAAAAFHRLTDGHPLHLRYSLEALIEKGAPLFSWYIEALPACPTGEIGSYYDSLCRGISENARCQLHLFAVTGFSWPPDHLRRVIDPSGSQPYETRGALRSIRHLFHETPLGLVPFHASLAGHLRQSPEHGDYREELLGQVAAWLAGPAPEAWRWSYKWLIDADRGGPEDLINGPDEAWLVDAVIERRPGDRIDRILGRASAAAFQRDDLPRTVELNVLADYAQRARYPYIYDLAPLTACALQTERRNDLLREMRAGLADLSAREMVALVEAEVGEPGGQELVHACLKEIFERLRGLVDRLYTSPDERQIPMNAVPWLLGFRKQTPTDKGVAAIRETADGGGSGFLAFVAARAKVGYWIDLPEVLAYISDETDLHEVAVGAFRHATTVGVDWQRWDERTAWRHDPMALALRLARKESLPDDLPPLTPWPAPEIDPHHFDPDGRRSIALDFHRVFFANLVHAWSGSGARLTCRWGGSDRHAMALAGHEIGRRLATATEVDLATAFSALPGVVRQSGEDTFDVHKRERDMRRAKGAIAVDLAVLRALAGGADRISDNEIQVLMASTDNWRSFRDAMLESRLPLLSPKALASAVQRECGRLAGEIGELPERYNDYARLAWLVSLHDPDSPEIRRLTALAARCAVGYGHHKDMLLTDVMIALEEAADELPQAVKGWMKRLAPFVDAVCDFTDGKETAYNKTGMGELLLRLAPQLVEVYVRHLVEQGDDYRADQVIAAYAAEADLESAEAKRLIQFAGGEETQKAIGRRLDPDAADAPSGDENIDMTGGALPPEPPLDITTFPPDQFEAFRRNVSSRWGTDQQAVILDWFRHWVEIDRDCALDALERAANAEQFAYDLRSAIMEAFHTVLPISGRDAAFEWLVRAHKSVYGWSTFLAPKAEAEAIWAELRKIYPRRQRDFIRKTASVDSSGEINDGPVFIGLSRLVTFLLRMNQPEPAAATIDRMVDVLLRRTADLPLVMPAWAEQLDTADVLHV